MSEAEHEFNLDAFFGFRAPLLSYGEWKAWSSGLRAASDQVDPERFARSYNHDCWILRERLKKLIVRPEIMESLHVASPDLVHGLPYWFQDPESGKGKRLESALVRYFARMCNRPTPFGLFAGHGMGRMGAETRLVVAPRSTWWRRSRLDMGFLCELAASLHREPALREELVYRANSSLYRIGDRYRYARVDVDDGQRHALLVETRQEDSLDRVLTWARDGMGLGDLRRALVADGLPQDEVRRYLNDLIDQQILVPDLEPTTTGPPPPQDMIQLLGRTEAAQPAARTLAEASRLLGEMDAHGLGNAPARYKHLIQSLKNLKVKCLPSRVLQVDLFLPCPNVTLGPAFRDEMLQAVELMQQLAPRTPLDPLKAFKEAFRGRYDQRWVPLAEALDPEGGVGFLGAGNRSQLAVPVLRGLPLRPQIQPEEPRLQGQDVHLLKRVLELRSVGAKNLELTDADVLAMAGNRPALPLPSSFFCLVELSAASPEGLEAGAYRVLFHGGWGPTAARMLGRFCHGDPDLRVEVERHLRQEEQINPHAIHAEIAHLPEGRMGNVLARPVLRGFEIPYLGRSGANPSQWIGLEDLFVGLAGERVVLWSRRLNKEVLPRLSSAAAYQDRGPEIYRFLASLQDQGVQNVLGFNWGHLASEPSLPRVVRGKLVLARAQWRWCKAELDLLREAKDACGRFLAVQGLRHQGGLPRNLVLADGDNELPVDMENVLSVEALWRVIKHRESVCLLEDFPEEGQLAAEGPDGAFKSQLVLVFLGRPATPEPMPSPPILSENPLRHTPGSHWLFAKLYMGLHSADTMLSGALGEWVQEILHSGHVDRWFFLRYADPEPHLRLRFHGDPKWIWGRLLPRLKGLIDPLVRGGVIWRFQLDTYEPETTRYGGVENLEQAERIFMADSEAALKILIGHPGAGPSGERWRLALVSADEFYASAGLPTARRLQHARNQCEQFNREFGLDSARALLGERFRAERGQLTALLEPGRDLAGPLAEGVWILHDRTEKIRPLFLETERRATLGKNTFRLDPMLGSFIHMSVNRLLGAAQREQEGVVYHFLARWYQSKLARARRTAGIPEV